MRAMTTSEFAQEIFNLFPSAVNKYYEFSCIGIRDDVDGNTKAIKVTEYKDGKTSVFIKGVNYSKMNAAQKKGAAEYVKTIKVEKVTWEQFYYYRNSIMVTFFALAGIFSTDYYRKDKWGNGVKVISVEQI